MINIAKCEAKLSASSLYYKMIIEILVGHPIYNSFGFEIENEINIKIYC